MKNFISTKCVKRGYITLLSVLVVGAVGVAITISLIVLGLGSSSTSLTYQHMHQAKAFAHTCAEEGLELIRASASYVGTTNLSFTQGTCSATVTSQGGENRTVTATGTVGTVVRKVTIVLIDIDPLIIISSWQEVQ